MSPMSPDRSPDADRPDEDVDAAFARIIAGWDETPSLPDPPSPGPPPPESPAALPGPPEPGPRDHVPPAEPEDEGYVPPDPPPLPRLDVPGALAWAAVILGPLFLLFAGLFWRTASPLWLGLAVLSFIGGFGALVMRLPSHRDSDGDDGAVV